MWGISNSNFQIIESLHYNIWSKRMTKAKKQSNFSCNVLLDSLWLAQLVVSYSFFTRSSNTDALIPIKCFCHIITCNRSLFEFFFFFEKMANDFREWYHFLFRDPLDTSQFIGWTLEYIYQMISGIAYLVISMIFASFFMTICFNHMAFCQQMQALINKLKQEINEGRNDRKKTLLILCEIVQLHTSTKEWVNDCYNFVEYSTVEYSPRWPFC